MTATGQTSGSVALATFTDDNFSVGAVSPASGLTLGGTLVTITGTGFNSGQSPYTVIFGSGTTVSANRVDDQTLTATTPAHTAGTVDVIVTRKNGNSTTATNGFTFTRANPTVTFTGAPSGAAYPSTFTVASSTNSSASPNYTSSGACSNVGTTYTMTSGTGTCTSAVTWAADANYNGASLSQATTALKAPQTISFGALAGKTYGDPDFGVSATATSGLGVSFSASGNCAIAASTVHITDAGSCTITASQAGDANYNAALSVSETFTLTKASSATVVSCPTVAQIYTGSPIEPCTAAATGVGGLNVAVTPVTYTSNTNVGTAGAGATYGGDANHFGSTGTGSFAIGQAASTTTVSCPAGPYSYTGAAQMPCSATVTGASLSLTPTPSYANNTDAGTATASYAFAGDPNHSGSSDSKTFTIGPASSTTTVSCPAGPYTYTGSAQTPCSATVTGVGGLSLAPTPSYSGNTNAGTATASYTFSGDANHTGSSDSKTFTIGQASSTTVVSFEAGPYTYRGSAFTATVAVTGAGGLSLTPAPSYSGDCTNVTGLNGCTASYTWTPDANHTGSSDSKSITPTQATSTTTVSCPAGPYTYTGSAQTPCSATVTGVGGLSLTPTPSYGGNTNAGTATASHTVPGDANHTGSSDSKTFGIRQANSSMTVRGTETAYDYSPAAGNPGTAPYSGASGVGRALTPTYSGNTQ